MEKIGYCRVSTKNQCTKAQEIELKNAGCTRFFYDISTGSHASRTGLNDLLEYIRADDQIIVTKLDRLARSTRDLYNIVEKIEHKRANLLILNANLDTSTAVGQLIFSVLSCIAEFERDLLLERQKEGIEQAKLAGKYTGRTPIPKEKLQLVADNLKSEKMSVRKACSLAGISPRTWYKALSQNRITL